MNSSVVFCDHSALLLHSLASVSLLRKCGVHPGAEVYSSVTEWNWVRVKSVTVPHILRGQVGCDQLPPGRGPHTFFFHSSHCFSAKKKKRWDFFCCCFSEKKKTLSKTRSIKAWSLVWKSCEKTGSVQRQSHALTHVLHVFALWSARISSEKWCKSIRWTFRYGSRGREMKTDDIGPHFS